MKRSRILALSLAAVAATATLGTSAQASPSVPAVESRADEAVLEVPDHDEWQRDVSQALRSTIPWLENRKNQGGGRLAIVLDIDNTALETYYHRGRANKPVLDVARRAKSIGFRVLFVTARGGSGNTRRELESAGYAVDELCGTNHRPTKAACRKKLTEAGYTITANIGNRDTDFTGGYYEKAYKLPDYNGELS